MISGPAATSLTTCQRTFRAGRTERRRCGWVLLLPPPPLTPSTRSQHALPARAPSKRSQHTRSQHTHAHIVPMNTAVWTGLRVPCFPSQHTHCTPANAPLWCRACACACHSTLSWAPLWRCVCVCRHTMARAHALHARNECTCRSLCAGCVLNSPPSPPHDLPLDSRAPHCVGVRFACLCRAMCVYCSNPPSGHLGPPLRHQD